MVGEPSIVPGAGCGKTRRKDRPEHEAQGGRDETESSGLEREDDSDLAVVKPGRLQQPDLTVLFAGTCADQDSDDDEGDDQKEDGEDGGRSPECPGRRLARCRAATARSGNRIPGARAPARLCRSRREGRRCGGDPQRTGSDHANRSDRIRPARASPGVTQARPGLLRGNAPGWARRRFPAPESRSSDLRPCSSPRPCLRPRDRGHGRGFFEHHAAAADRRAGGPQRRVHDRRATQAGELHEIAFARPESR